jgi:hypothetical protein
VSTIIATAALITALVVGAMIAPRAFSDVTFSMDPCVLESGDRGVISPDCIDVGHGIGSRSRATEIWAGELRPRILASAGRPVL